MKAKPVLTLGCVTSSRMGLGYAISAFMKGPAQPENSSVDKQMLLGHLAFGSGVGVALYYWFIKALPCLFPLPGLYSTIGKTLLDQVLMGPIFVAAYIYSFSLLRTSSHSQSFDTLRSRLAPTVLLGAQLAIPISFVNFYMLKPLYQPLLVNFGGLCWNVYMAYSYSHTH